MPASVMSWIDSWAGIRAGGIVDDAGSWVMAGAAVARSSQPNVPPDLTCIGLPSDTAIRLTLLIRPTALPWPLVNIAAWANNMLVEMRLDGRQDCGEDADSASAHLGALSVPLDRLAHSGEAWPHSRGRHDL